MRADDTNFIGNIGIINNLIAGFPYLDDKTSWLAEMMLPAFLQFLTKTPVVYKSDTLNY